MKSVVSQICDGSWITLGSRKKLVKREMFFVGRHLKLQWFCPGYQAYESLTINKMWLPVVTEKLGISLFSIYQLSLIRVHRVHALYHIPHSMLHCTSLKNLLQAKVAFIDPIA